jgi:hypothetical protein
MSDLQAHIKASLEFDPLGPLSVDFGDEPYADIELKLPHRRVARLWQDDAPVREFNEEQARYAHLFAASPDLLAAAKQAEKWIAIHMADKGWPAERLANPPEGSHLFNLRAAIAKAGGAS